MTISFASHHFQKCPALHKEAQSKCIKPETNYFSHQPHPRDSHHRHRLCPQTPNLLPNSIHNPPQEIRTSIRFILNPRLSSPPLDSSRHCRQISQRNSRHRVYSFHSSQSLPHEFVETFHPLQERFEACSDVRGEEVCARRVDGCAARGIGD